MKQIFTIVRDDIDFANGVEPDYCREADIRISFSVGIDTYELELCTYNHDEVMEQLAPLIAAATKIDRPHVPMPTRSTDVAAKKAEETAARERRDRIREWASDHPVWKSKYNGKGRIPAALEKDYEEARALQ